jgi:tryptophan 2,3-dioxygenase
MSSSNLNTPILPGSAATDYERYLHTDVLLSLQKPRDARLHRDELIFQTIHQSSELWLKLAQEELHDAADRIDRDDLWLAIRMLRRASASLDRVLDATLMLEHLAPADYHVLRPALGHGSGFDSPGFRQVHDAGSVLGAAFDRLLGRRGVTVDALIAQPSAHADVFQIAESLLDWDERLVRWRTLHLKMVERVIGGHVIGTQGTPVEVLGRRIDVRAFPALWDARNRLTHAREPGAAPTT